MQKQRENKHPHTPIWQTADKSVWHTYLKEFGRENRNNPTEAEAILWQYVRKRQIEKSKFLRQHSIASFITDFACLEHKLIIEVDGEIHDN
jgi:phosphoribosylformylglycinamidine synthase subunit PurQ / glutaminase